MNQGWHHPGVMGVLVAASAALIVTGCASQPSAPAGAPAASESLQADEPTSGVAELQDGAPPLADGTLLTHEPEALAEGTTAYRLTSGEYIVLDVTQPLPEVVREDLAAPVRDGVEASPSSQGTTPATAAVIESLERAESTGRTVVLLSKEYSPLNPGEEPGWIYFGLAKVDGEFRMVSGEVASTTRDAAHDASQAWISSRPDPAAHDLVDATAE
ncbi:hypothetical protein [Actinotalea sp. K2]|uniref:hypothetical protein n=1 Tax=Actinotalea sp. K2 TaxID=2939438 RepID=UPI002017F9B4|nr:hypothetical protein [Actinotalea sp. K2]MCL3860637.1 hypothetical protein [Actinotalea sp. K2]